MKKTLKNKFHTGLCLAVCLCLLGSLAGCGKQQSSGASPSETSASWVKVSVTDGKNLYFYSCKAGTPLKDVFSDLKLSLEDTDDVSYELSFIVDADTDVVINRQYRVYISSNEEVTEITVNGSIVRDALLKAGINLKNIEKLNFDESDFLENEMVIEITLSEEESEEDTEDDEDDDDWSEPVTQAPVRPNPNNTPTTRPAPTETTTEAPTQAPVEIPTEITTEAPTEAPTEAYLVSVETRTYANDPNHGIRIFTYSDGSVYVERY